MRGVWIRVSLWSGLAALLGCQQRIDFGRSFKVELLDRDLLLSSLDMMELLINANSCLPSSKNTVRTLGF